MKNKKFLQYGGIAAVVLITLFLFSLFTSDTRNFQDVDTSVAMEQLDANNVSEAQIDDREQRLRLTLREPIDVEEREGVEEIITQFPARTAPLIFDKVEASDAEWSTALQAAALATVPDMNARREVLAQAGFSSAAGARRLEQVYHTE